jgi:hypothetical protein
VIHEHEQLEIASAAMDFPLSPDVERELELELAECPICAERAAAYKAQMRLLARLPVVNASDATRRRVMSAAMTGRTDARSPMVLALAAALLLAAALAATAVVGAFLQDRQPTELGVVDASSSPAPASVDPAGATPPPSPEPTPISTSVVVIGAEIPTGQVLDVVTTNLRVRSEPRVADDSALLEPFLQPGDRVVVLDGPVIASDYAWYRVVPIASGSADRTADDLPLGWVASADHDATPWVAAAEPDCPTGVVDIGALVEMHRYERLACFRDEGLTFLALLDGDPDTGWWALDQLIAAARTNPVDVAPVVDAPFGLTDIPRGHAVVLSGAFDRPADFDCQPVPIDDPVIADLNCRSTFVLTSATRGPYQAEVGSPAVTVTDNLRVRSAPEVSDESARLDLLDDGTGLLVLDGPIVRSGYVWYQVAVPSMRASTGGMLGGWVAVGSRTGEQWLDDDATACPSSGNLTFDQLADLVHVTTVHRLPPCLGREGLAGEVTVDARMRLECSGASAANPGWLADPPYTLSLSRLNAGTTEIAAVTQDTTFGLTCGAPATGSDYHLVGHFDDATAGNCRSDTPASDADPQLANDLAVLECRMKFVVDGGSASGPGPTRPPLPPAP